MTLKVGLVPMETTVQTISGLFFKVMTYVMNC